MSGTYRIDEFRRKYPHIASEILDEDSKSSITLTVDMGVSDPWHGYIPTVIDYIRRCKNIDEAFEVIDYLVNHGELSPGEGEELKETLKSKGLDYFGGRKEADYYYKEAKRYWERLASSKRE